MENSTESIVQVLAQYFKGCLRFRLLEYKTTAGETMYAIEIVAWNNWAGQGKILFVRAGLNYDLARAGFKELIGRIRDYDWAEGEYVFEHEAG